MRRTALVTVGAAVAALALSGCTGSVAVPAVSPTPSGSVATICSAVMNALPLTVLGGARRDSTGGVDTAAWAKPAITLRCGVPAPAGLGPASECIEVDDVGWFAAEQTDGTLYTTIGRAAYVEVAVPKRYAPEINALADVAAAVQTNNPLRTPCQG